MQLLDGLNEHRPHDPVHKNAPRKPPGMLHPYVIFVVPISQATSTIKTPGAVAVTSIIKTRIRQVLRYQVVITWPAFKTLQPFGPEGVIRVFGKLSCNS